MATTQVAISTVGDGDGSLVKFTWPLTATDDGMPVGYAQWSDRSVQFTGTFGAGTVLLEGSNDGGTTWATLLDSKGNAISITAAGLVQIGQLAELVRPRASVAVTSVVATMLARRLNTLRN